MIQVLFELGGTRVGVEIEGESVIFFDYQSLLKSPLEGLKLSYEGTIKEFPDLKDNPEWRSIATQRFKDHVKSLENEDKRCEYVISELKKIGYKPLYKHKKGFRIEKIKDGTI